MPKWWAGAAHVRFEREEGKRGGYNLRHVENPLYGYEAILPCLWIGWRGSNLIGMLVCTQET